MCVCVCVCVCEGFNATTGDADPRRHQKQQRNRNTTEERLERGQCGCTHTRTRTRAHHAYTCLQIILKAVVVLHQGVGCGKPLFPNSPVVKCTSVFLRRAVCEAEPASQTAHAAVRDTAAKREVVGEATQYLFLQAQTISAAAASSLWRQPSSSQICREGQVGTAVVSFL